MVVVVKLQQKMEAKKIRHRIDASQGDGIPSSPGKHNTRLAFSEVIKLI